ncbi:MAG: hypothetical protein AABX66_01795 [Nanoarchaeota archaeon]
MENINYNEKSPFLRINGMPRSPFIPDRREEERLTASVMNFYRDAILERGEGFVRNSGVREHAS